MPRSRESCNEGDLAEVGERIVMMDRNHQDMFLKWARPRQITVKQTSAGMLRLLPGVIVVASLLLSSHVDAQSSRRPELEPLSPGGLVPKGLQPPGSSRAVSSGGLEAGGGIEHLLGVKFGVTYQVLGRPEDLPGEVTLLSGSAFSGPGFVVGPSYEIVGLLPSISLETGLLYTRTSATGFEQRGMQKREVLIESASMRLPLWLKLRFPSSKAIGFHFGLGAEVLYGFSSGVTVREESVPLGESLDLETASVTAFHLSGQFGVEFDLVKLRIPLNVHVTFNPGAGGTTKDRYVAYSEDDPGPFKSEFDYELLFLLGLTLPL